MLSKDSGEASPLFVWQTELLQPDGETKPCTCCCCCCCFPTCMLVSSWSGVSRGIGNQAVVSPSSHAYDCVPALSCVSPGHVYRDGRSPLALVTSVGPGGSCRRLLSSSRFVLLTVLSCAAVRHVRPCVFPPFPPSLPPRLLPYLPPMTLASMCPAADINPVMTHIFRAVCQQDGGRCHFVIYSTFIAPPPLSGSLAWT